MCILSVFPPGLAIDGYILDVFHPSQHIRVALRKFGAEDVVLPSKEDITMIRGAAPIPLSQTAYPEKCC